MLRERRRAVRAEASGTGWTAAIRRAPLGVLALATFLAFLGAGFLLGGFYLIFAATALGWAGWAMLLLAAPLTLYMALHLVLLTRWAWSAMVFLLLLLLLSSLVRALLSPGVPVAAFAELVLEVLFLGYLLRPRIRTAFGR